MRFTITVLLVMAGSLCLFAGVPDAPSFEDLFRDLPATPHAFDFLLLGWIPGAHIANAGASQSYVLHPVITAPRPLQAPDPYYPEEARRKHIQGTVRLWVVVGPDGLPHQIEVQKPLGYGLDEEAVKAVQRWRFQPALKDGRPVAVRINIDVNFRLYR